MFHGLHQRLFYHVDGTAVLLQRLGNVVSQMAVVTLAQGIQQPLLYCLAAPRWTRRRTSGNGGRTCQEFTRKRNQALRSFVVLVQDDVLHGLQQRGLYVVVHLQHARIHDGHVQSFADGVVEEYGVHGLAHLVVTAETERQVAHATAGLRLWQVLLNPTDGTDKVHPVGLVLFQSRSNGQDVHVEDDILWWETNAR